MVEVMRTRNIVSRNRQEGAKKKIKLIEIGTEGKEKSKTDTRKIVDE